MKRVGITGGIGSGKSTVVACFAKRGVNAFVADSVAAAYYTDHQFLDEVQALLGPRTINPDGTANKRAIADIVFNDPQALASLNALIHPRVMRDFGHYCSLHAAEPYVLFESAILFETGLNRMMDCTICVYLDLEERLRRLALRDNATREQLMARIANQLPAEQVMMQADYVILNYEGNPRDRQVAHIDNLIRK